MGRTPCCDKVGLKKGPWTPEEDQKLLAYIDQHGHGSWRALPGRAGLQRCGKSCRLRWTNYLRPDIKRGKFSLQEEQSIIQLHALLGNRWSAIATHLPKRTDNEIKNYWNTHLKKRLDKMGIDPVTHKPKNEALLSTNGPSKSSANLSHMAQWESARLEAEARLARQSKLRASSISDSSLPDFPSNPAKLSAPVSPPLPCLDILKAWSGMWTKPPETGTSGGDQESPTSTLSFSENGAPRNGENSTQCIEFVENSGSLMKDGGGEGWKNVSDLSIFNSSLSIMDSAWAAESINGNENLNENVNGENFMERFTDLLLNNNNSTLTTTSEEPESDEGGSYYYGDNKNYWNNILNLINASPTDSPML